MKDILAQIVDAKRPQLEAAKRRIPAVQLEARIAAMKPARDFAGAFRQPGIRVIADLKKASPSKGLIRPDFPVAELAKSLIAGGAAALSVLTEENFFLGSLGNLEKVAAFSPIPLLRKDFIFDPYQLLEARAAGGDAILLIAAMLDQPKLLALADAAHKLGLAVLGEAHNREELRRLVDSPVDLIGVNARSLRTFATSLDLSAELIGEVPAARLPIAESAITGRDDIERLRSAGAAGFLIGESLMRAADPAAKLRELIA